MGLAGGPKGAKAVFKDKFAHAFREFQNLVSVRQEVGVSRAQTLNVVDGNVLVMQCPTSIDTFDGYLEFMAGQLHRAIAAAGHVVVVFDEPENLTLAKRAEQQKRDERRKPLTPICSPDLSACPTDDNYTAKDLRWAGLNVRLLLNHRPARSRFYDGLCSAVLARLKESLEGGEWSLTFDGIDPRGADRPVGEPRRACILSSHPELFVPLLTREVSIGEGDLKLRDVPERVRKADLGIVLNLVTTIDTDSLAIELIGQAAHDKAGETDHLTLLCLKETSRKREGGDYKPGGFLCVDMEILLSEVLGFLRVPQAAQQNAISLLAGALALCGCDFVAVKGLNAHDVLSCVRDVARRKPELLAKVGGVREGDAQMAKGAVEALEEVLEAYIAALEGKPRGKKTAATVSTYTEIDLERAVWVMSYWSGVEYKDVSEFGFSIKI